MKFKFSFGINADFDVEANDPEEARVKAISLKREWDSRVIEQTVRWRLTHSLGVPPCGIVWAFCPN